MAFKEYINSLPNVREDTIRSISKECSVTVNTVRRWISGEFRPTTLKQSKISQLLQIPIKDLFPENKQNN